MIYLYLYFGIGLIVAIFYLVRYFRTPIPDRYDLLGPNWTTAELQYSIDHEVGLVFQMSYVTFILWPVAIYFAIKGKN